MQYKLCSGSGGSVINWADCGSRTVILNYGSGSVRYIQTLTGYYIIEDFKKFQQKFNISFIFKNHYRTYLTTYFFFFNGHKNIQVGSGSRINLPPGSGSIPRSRAVFRISRMKPDQFFCAPCLSPFSQDNSLGVMHGPNNCKDTKPVFS
jgi:hypothetical protein